MKRTNFLLAKLTSFRSLAALKDAMSGGYIPTIMSRTARHGELLRALRAAGIEVRS